jgi:hypothetical protein
MFLSLSLSLFLPFFSLSLSHSLTHSLSQPPSLLDAIDSHPETSTRRSWASIVHLVWRRAGTARHRPLPSETGWQATGATIENPGDWGDAETTERVASFKSSSLLTSHFSLLLLLLLLLLSIIVTRDPLLPVRRPTTDLLASRDCLRSTALANPIRLSNLPQSSN